MDPVMHGTSAVSYIAWHVLEYTGPSNATALCLDLQPLVSAVSTSIRLLFTEVTLLLINHARSVLPPRRRGIALDSIRCSKPDQSKGLPS